MEKKVCRNCYIQKKKQIINYLIQEIAILQNFFLVFFVVQKKVNTTKTCKLSIFLLCKQYIWIYYNIFSTHLVFRCRRLSIPTDFLMICLTIFTFSWYVSFDCRLYGLTLILAQAFLTSLIVHANSGFEIGHCVLGLLILGHHP